MLRKALDFGTESYRILMGVDLRRMQVTRTIGLVCALLLCIVSDTEFGKPISINSSASPLPIGKWKSVAAWDGSKWRRSVKANDYVILGFTDEHTGFVKFGGNAGPTGKKMDFKVDFFPKASPPYFIDRSIAGNEKTYYEVEGSLLTTLDCDYDVYVRPSYFKHPPSRGCIAKIFERYNGIV